MYRKHYNAFVLDSYKYFLKISTSFLADNSIIQPCAGEHHNKICLCSGTVVNLK